MAGSVIAISLLYALLQKEKKERATDNQKDAEAQRDVLIKAHKNITEAQRQGVKREKEALGRADNGDWSDLN